MDDICLKCGQRQCRPSKPTGVVDHLLRFVLLGPFRCESCLHRFYRFTWPWAGPWEKSKFHPRRLASRIWANSFR
jgi:hypothetical protein